jgi:N6-L-threonylcarbamoyladenine synthase
LKDIVLGFDTSNYTTSCAFFDGTGGKNSGRLLDVAPGQLGLRQSDALFSHIKRLPEIVKALNADGNIIAIGASTKPRETEDSYMPCFLAGTSHGKVIAEIMGVPFFEFSHQQGHIAAAAWSAGREELINTEHLAWHLSGGTTELLHVIPWRGAVKCDIIGGTTDVSAGQLIDRTGQLLKLRFPAGRELDKIAQDADKKEHYLPKTNDMYFSLSGVEHKMKQLHELREAPENIAFFVLSSIVSVVHKATEQALVKFGDLPVLYSGGVASNTLLRSMTTDGIFSEPAYSTDNAMGIAILTYKAAVLKGV